MLDRATGATDASRTLVDSLSSVREDGGELLAMCNTEDKKEAAPVRTPWTGSCGPEGTPYPTVMARLALFELLLGKMRPHLAALGVAVGPREQLGDAIGGEEGRALATRHAPGVLPEQEVPPRLGRGAGAHVRLRGGRRA